MVKLNDEWVFYRLADLLLVVDYCFLFVIENKPLRHHFHSIEFPIGQTSHQVHLTESPNSQTLQDLILVQTSILLILQTLEIYIAIQYSVLQRNAVVQEDVPVD